MRFILDIQLKDIDEPKVTRRLAVPAKLTFHELNLMIQAAMGWENQHLYCFQESEHSRFFKVVSPYAEEFGMDGTHILANQVLWDYMNQFVMKDEKRLFLYYEYDFGDGWIHEIDVSGLDRSNRTSPELLSGSGACPPENCGGISGYQRMKDYLSGKMDHQEYSDWYSAVNAERFDVHHFNIAKGNKRVKRWRMLEG